MLAASLRSQVNPANRTEFKEVSPERCVMSLRKRSLNELNTPRDYHSAFADFAIGSIVLHFFVYNFLG